MFCATLYIAVYECTYLFVISGALFRGSEKDAWNEQKCDCVSMSKSKFASLKTSQCVKIAVFD